MAQRRRRWATLSGGGGAERGDGGRRLHRQAAVWEPSLTRAAFGNMEASHNFLGRQPVGWKGVSWDSPKLRSMYKATYGARVVEGISAQLKEVIMECTFVSVICRLNTNNLSFFGPHQTMTCC
uniref:Uncharacterized protein n=1 Tax=Leersia perrieri TaxID=77586 RepID=A0A0D9XIK3_9ORYZ